MPNLPDVTVADWDVTIERARQGAHAEDKLRLTIDLLNTAAQRSRLRGEQQHLNDLSRRLAFVHELLDAI